MQPHLPPSRRAAFSLIELLVTIFIIGLLVGLSFPVVASFKNSAKAYTAQSQLTGLGAAADNYNVVTQSAVDHKVNTDAFGNAINLNVSTANDLTLAYFVFTAGQVPETARVIANAAKTNLTLGGRPLTNIGDDIATGALNLGNLNLVELLDPWGSEIRYAYKVSKADSFTADDYLPAYPNAFFASAGPDGLWGAVDANNQPDPSVDVDGDGEPDAADNLYSFEID